MMITTRLKPSTSSLPFLRLSAAVIVIPIFFDVILHVGTSCHQFKISNAIILSIFISMMNNLIASYFSANVFFHHHVMFKSIFAIDEDLYIAILGQAFPSRPSIGFFPGIKMIATNCRTKLALSSSDMSSAQRLSNFLKAKIASSWDHRVMVYYFHNHSITVNA